MGVKQFLAWVSVWLVVAGISPCSGQQTNLEAEAGILVGVTTSRAVGGYAGTGYVVGFDATGDLVRWNFNATPGFYRLTIRYRTPYGTKGFEGKLNGIGFSGMFPASSTFAGFDAGRVELLATNQMELGGGWNWYEIDRAELTWVPPSPPPMAVPLTLVNTQATLAARSLFAAIAESYGRKTWSAQQDVAEVPNIETPSGQRPAIIGGDLIEYSPTRVQYGGMPVGETEKLIALETNGYALTLSWHWNAPTNLLNTAAQPWWRGFYTEGTTFDIAAALANTNSVEYGMILRDIDAIAVQLRKLADRNIPVLWRPLHEAEGGWFWWGAKGADPLKKLWRLLFTRLTYHHRLNNLIWVFSGEQPDWYPGNDVVDVVGVDGYPADRSDALSGNWEPLKARFDGVKLLALTEFGGVPDVERMQRFGVWWAWFMSWSGTYGPSSMATGTVARIYQSPGVVAVAETQGVKPRFLSGTMSGGRFRVVGTGPRGASFRLFSTSVVNAAATNWTTVWRTNFAGGVFSVEDAGGGSRRFYRVTRP